MAVLPCSDYDGCVEKSNHTTTEQHTDHDTNDLACSPFCCCSCCGASMCVKLYFPEIEWAKPIFSVNTFFSLYISILSNYYGNIWQPPKMS